MGRFIDILGLSTAAFLAMSTPAFAYLDPGTGSILLQGIIGAFVGAAVFGRSIRYRIKEFFAGRRANPAGVSTGDDAAE